MIAFSNVNIYKITWLKYKAQPQDVLVFQIKSANKINKFSFFFSVCPLTFEIPSNNKT